MSTLFIAPPAAFLNSNDRLHHQAKAKLTKAWRDEARVGAVSELMPAYDRAHVTVGIRFPNNVRRDVGNFYPTAKAILDGLVDAGVFPDDNDEHITGPDMRRIRPNGSPLVVITITETP